ncbi:MAG: PfkB family carbohydrate kinase [Clostridia bacterium]|nr:PfkB family carbohydrate kinase [Clostridia bacterium]
MGIVVFGAVFVDIKGYPFDTYIPAGRNAGRVEEVHGGVSRNIVEDIANVELRPTFVSLVDQSGAAMAVVQKLKKHKVNTDFMEARPNGMGTWLAIFDNSGDVIAAISQRPDLAPVADILDRRGDEIFSKADSIVLEIDMEKDIVKRIFKYADKYRIPVYAAVSNMSIALKRRDFLQLLDCFVCNRQEAGILFSEDYSNLTPEEFVPVLEEKARMAQIPRMVVTLGGDGAVYTELGGASGLCPAIPVVVKDTTGAGDAFIAGISIGLTYGKTLAEACAIGSRMASAVICTGENVCPRFLPEEFGIPLDENGDPIRNATVLRGPVPDFGL